MIELKSWTYNEKKRELKLFFKTTQEYKEVRSTLAKQLRFAKFGDSENPPAFKGVVNDKELKITIGDSEHIKNPGEGVEICKAYLEETFKLSLKS